MIKAISSPQADRFPAEERVLLGGFMLTALSGVGQNYCLGIFSSQLAESFGFNVSQIGIVFTVSALAGASLLAPVDRVLSGFGLRGTSAAVVVLAGLGAGAMALATHVALLVLGLLVLRMAAAGLMTQTAMVGLAKGASARRAPIVLLGYTLAEALVPITALSLSNALGWRNTFLVASGALILLGAPFLLLVLTPVRMSIEQHKVVSGVSSQVPRSFFLLLSALVFPALAMTCVYFAQDRILSENNWSKNFFAATFVSFAFAKVLGVLLSPKLIISFSSRSLLLTSLGPMGLALILFSTGGPAWVCWPAMALAGFAMGMSHPLMNAFSLDLGGSAGIARLRRILSAAWLVASAVAPLLMGLMTSAGLSARNCLWALFALLTITLASALRWACPSRLKWTTKYQESST